MKTNIFELDTPALLIDIDKVRGNVEKMQLFAEGIGVELRPHVKTHKIPEIAKMQLERGACGIACAKTEEAEIMFAAGIRNIQIANVIVGEAKIRRMIDMIEAGAKLTCGVDSREGAEALSETFSAQGLKLKVLIKIDVGFGRLGVSPEKAVEFAKSISDLPGIEIVGIFSHGGQVYGAKTYDEVRRGALNESSIMSKLATEFKKAGFKLSTVSVGSTPGAKFCAIDPGITELRAGNYVYYDMIQVGLGSARKKMCAMTILATVVSIPASDRAIIDAGSKALGLDRGAHGFESTSGYGKIIGSDAEIYRLSEEHGFVRGEVGKFEVGDKIRIIPNHACRVSNLFDEAYEVSGDYATGVFKISARGKMR